MLRVFGRWKKLKTQSVKKQKSDFLCLQEPLQMKKVVAKSSLFCSTGPGNILDNKDRVTVNENV